MANTKLLMIITQSQFIINVVSFAFDYHAGTVASWLVRSTPGRAVRVRALAADFVLCSWARHFTLNVK